MVIQFLRKFIIVSFYIENYLLSIVIETMSINPLELTYEQNVKNFVKALEKNDVVTVKLYTVDTNYFKPKNVISNRSLLELTTNFTSFESWMVVYNYCGADINNVPKGIYQFDYIVEAGSNQDYRILQFLMNLDIPDKVMKINAALHFAVSARHYNTVMTILQSGMANASCGLHSAVVLYPAIVQKLIDYGGDLLYKDGSGLDVITFALLRETPHPLLYSLLNDNANLLYYSIYNNDTKNIILAFNNPVNRSFQYKLLGHPLLCAVQYGNLETIKLVMQLFNNPNIKNPVGPMVNFKIGGNENIYNIVVKRGFDIDIYNYIFHISDTIDKNNVSNCRTPLSAAVREGNYEKIEYLLKIGCNPNFITSEGTCGHECIYCCYDEKNTNIMKLLLKYGLNLYLSYPESQSYVPYRGLNVIQLAKQLGKPDPSILNFN